MNLTRREVAAMLALGLVARPGRDASAAAGSVVRATNQGSSLVEQSRLGGDGMTLASRRPMRLPVSIRRSRVFIPVFTIGTVKTGRLAFPTDQFFSERRSYQRGIDPVFASGSKGRRLYTFGGRTSFDYDPDDWDRTQPGILSDWLDHDEIPADTDFEWTGAVRTPPGLLPVTAVAFGDAQPGFGTITSARDILGTDGLGGIRTFGQNAPYPIGSAFYDNAILLFEAPAGTPGIVSIGDSNLYAFGSDKGDEHGNAGIFTRGFVRRRRVPHLNLGRGSDGDFALGTARERGALRRRLIEVLHAEGGFTHRVHANGTNDLTKGFPIATWTPQTSYALWDSVHVEGGKSYICTRAGRSSPDTRLAGSGRAIADGTCQWAEIEGLGPSGHDQQLGRLVADEVRSNAWLREVLPDVPAYVSTVLPHDARSTDRWATFEGQTPSQGWGDTSSPRSRLNAFRRSLFDLYGYAGVLDVNLYVEESYPPTETSRWRSDGQPKTYVIDGVHTSAFGSEAASRVVDAIRF